MSAMGPTRREGAAGLENDPATARLTDEVLAAVESILIVADRPVSDEEIAAALGIDPRLARDACQDLADEYRGAHGTRPRGFEVARVAGGWRLVTTAAHADVVAAFVLEGQSAKLTQASLETLAVIAYRQPVSRGRISAIRGVNVDGVVRTLVTRGLVTEVGVDEEGGAILYGTTDLFLERMGFDSLADLAPLAPYLPGDEEVAALRDEREFR